jgi:HPt (histidine-containing phosphotransfer) domain-containing protein
MIDLTFLEKFTNGNKKKMQRYINLYLGIAPGTFNKMEQNIIDQDWDQLRINAHSLKPQADYMGIPDLKEVLIDIENSAGEGNANALQGLYEEALNLHVESEEALNDFLESI